MIFPSWLKILLISLCYSLTLTRSEEENEKNLVKIIRNLENNLNKWKRHLEYRSVSYLDQSDITPEYTSEFVIRINGGEQEARLLAEKAQYEYVDKVRGFRDTYRLIKRNLPDRNKREAHAHIKDLNEYENVEWFQQQRVKRRVKRDENADLLFNDPLWSKQWPLHDTRTELSLPKLDLHVIGAWKLGYTGKGIVVSILDDGIQHNHTDLEKNYDPKASYDLNDNDDDPMPTFNDYNKHGTRCAGEVSMVANNKVCGVGVAFDSKIGGVRMLDGKITDRLEAEALKFNIDHIDIFSASWGPNDDGRTVEGPGTLAEQAIIDGINEGRNGKGTIYVWASGNGGTYNDDCNCDGYTDSIFTLSVSSASQSGHFPWYGEKCASTLATTYSSGAYSDQKITTTDLGNICTNDHTGTSASAPLAAGIVALGLEANPSLTWRDVQHITVWTAEPAPLMHNDGWHKNGRGLQANVRFGFGLMNAEAFVKTAKSWKNVPKQRICTTTFPKLKPREFQGSKPGIVKFKTDACKGQTNEINVMEHLQLVIDIEYTRRGNLAIFVVSPIGTKTQLLSPRKRDNSKAGFRKWPFMSIHTWGEDPKGWWQLEVYDKQEDGHSNYHGSIKNLSMVIYGTKESPKHYDNPRQYNMEYNRVGDRAVHEKRQHELQKKAKEVSENLLRSLDVHGPMEDQQVIDGHIRRVDRALDLIEAASQSKYDPTKTEPSIEETLSK